MTLVPPASSKDGHSRKKDKTPTVEETTSVIEEERPVVEETALAGAPRPPKRLERATKGKAKVGTSEQVATGASDNATEEVTPAAQTAKRRKKKTPKNGREKDLAKVTVQASPGTMAGLEDAFRQDCGVAAVSTTRTLKRAPRKKQQPHPIRVKDGGDILITKCQNELYEFKRRTVHI